ncbi:unnamed protein product [Rotaria socialis]|uniref:RING-type domain-containing protein n=1 Tax=Rotaria socialis TaxID=392032 RepID=A0A817S0Z7_9BILA|nr:unnamed protein product [Rotaria socialis]CAF3337084.1 unnamed protein product [Rotaria socialis]CAF3376162.1 unnamed protein product [Rotaria socialis]CAF3520253.1 unnamed protein product [Rotaria socialis]CAF3772266.1 unnamed protein product [Rotaria socialis]
MAQAVTTSNELAMPSFCFHKTFGQNMRLENNGTKAVRYTSFDHGITFTDKSININERIHLKIVEVDETRQWCGSLAIGFTQVDPGTIRQEDLPKSALPNLSPTNKFSYVKRLYETLTKQLCIIFYYNPDGAYFILDGKEQEICKSIDIKKPLWAVIDVYGNVKAVTFTTPLKTTDDGKSLFAKYPEKPDKLPILYFTQLRTENFQPVTFSNVHGPELELYCEYKVALRKRTQKLVRPYLFINFPLAPGDELYIRILSIDPNYRTPGIFGFTNVRPSKFADKLEALPAVDPAALVDRKEYWLLREEPFDDTLSELDEYRILFDKTSGEMLLCRNNDTVSQPRILTFADLNETFYPFLFLNGRITALSVFALIAPNVRLTEANLPLDSNNRTDDCIDEDDSDRCTICYDAKATCVLIPCGHMIFCTKCKVDYELRSTKICPKCRAVYEQAIEVEAD